MNAKLRFIAEDLDPTTVTQALGLSPSSSGRRGDAIVVTLSRGRVASRPASAGYWTLEVPGCTSAELRASLQSLLDRAPEPIVWKSLGMHAEITIHEAPWGATPEEVFGHDSLRRLNSRGVTVVINEE